MRSVDAGYFASQAAARVGRFDKAPPQLGQRPFNLTSAQAVQKVHSSEQIHASSDSGARSVSQHSQPGRICSMSASSLLKGSGLGGNLSYFAAAAAAATLPPFQTRIQQELECQRGLARTGHALDQVQQVRDACNGVT
jgi:hypothetical protein